MATRKIYTSINLNSNELSDFFIGHRTSDPAPLEGGVYYNTLLHDFIVCRNGKWEPLLHGYWAVDSDGNLVTDKQVVIKNNAIIQGDTASGGTGEDTGGGQPAEIILDDEMSDSSENAVKNRVIKAYIDLHPQYEDIDGEVEAPDFEVGGGGGGSISEEQLEDIIGLMIPHDFNNDFNNDFAI